MGESPIAVKKEIIEQFAKSAPSEFKAFLRQAAGAPQRRGAADTPRKFYPPFEHLLIFLYARYFSKDVLRIDVFGQLTPPQKICLGEAIDILIFSNFLPAHTPTTPRLSLLQLCYDNRFGFRDDPVLLQKMWYVRAHVLLLDSADASGSGGRWKWYDHHLTLVIYSWVRHNRKYHGCPKESCHCRHMIDLYGLSIHRFKGLYMALEKQCVNQLHFIRANEPLWVPSDGGKSLSRAVDVTLYEKPTRHIWPICLVDRAADPNPPEPPSIPSTSTTTPTNPAPPAPPVPPAPLNDPPPPAPAQPPPPTTPAPKLPGLPPPHPSLPARPRTFDVQQTFPPQQRVWQMQFPPGYTSVPAPIPATAAPSVLSVPSTQTIQAAPSVTPTVETQQAQLPPTGPRSMQGSAYRYANPTVNPPTQPSQPANSTPSMFQMKVGPPTRQTVIDMPAVKIGPPVRTKMFPPPNAPTGPAAATRTSSSPTKDAGDKVAPATPSSATSTPSMDPASPVQSTHSQATTEGAKPQTPVPPAVDKSIPPSAPRSMRAAAANAKAGGAIPTGPRALMGATKTAAVGSMAGVPSGPRALRGLGGAAAKPTPSSNNNDDPPIPTGPKGAKDAGVVLRAVKEEGGITEAQPTPLKSDKTEVPISASNVSTPTPTVPVNPQPITGKRTRSEMKEDELKASPELRDKQAEQKEEGHKKTDKEKTTTQPRTPPRSRSVALSTDSSSLPPAKRLRQLVEPDSPSSSKGRSTRALTPVSKGSTKLVVPAKSAAKSDAVNNSVVGEVTPSLPIVTIAPVEVIEAKEVISPTKKTFTSKAIKSKSKARPASPLPTSKNSTPAPQSEAHERSSDKPKTVKGTDDSGEPEKAELKTRSTKSKTPATKSKVKATKESTVEVEVAPEKASESTTDKVDPKPLVAEAMELDPTHQMDALPDMVKSEESIVDPSSQPSNSASSEIISSLRSGPPFPIAIVHASDPKTRMQSQMHEARRLICLMIWLGIPLEWESIYVTEIGIAIRERAMPMVVASLTEDKVTQLMSIGISLVVSPIDSLSDGDTDDVESPPRAIFSTSNELKLSVPHGDGLVRLFDGKEERRMRHKKEEGKRLVQMIAALLKWPKMEEKEYRMESVSVGSTSLTAMVFSKETSQKIDIEKATVLGEAGIAVYHGSTQIAGPVSLFVKDVTSPTYGEATHNWKSMRAEVAKMRLPWESPSARDSFSSPATSATFPTRGSSYDSSDSRLSQSFNSFTSDGAMPSPYSRLLRPALWTSSTNIMTRMATAGIRWNGLGSEEVEWSDVTDDEDEEMDEVRVGVTRVSA